jgi:hypothetical protein
MGNFTKPIKCIELSINGKRCFKFSYIKQQKTEIALDFLCEGAKELFTAQQYGSGIDLANFLIDEYNKIPIAVNQQSFNRINDIYHLFPSSQGPDFLYSCLKWSSKFGVFESGDPVIHTLLAQLLISIDGRLEEALKHFFLDNTGTNLGKALSISTDMTFSESHLCSFIASYCSKRFIMSAWNCFDTFTKELKLVPDNCIRIKRMTRDFQFFENRPFLLLSQFLIISVQHGDKDLFLKSKSCFQKIIQQFPHLECNIECLGESIFGLRSVSAHQSKPDLGSLLKMLGQFN